MKQYCRYCANAVLIGDLEFYCEIKQKEYRESKGKRLNKCRDFEFNPLDLYSPGYTFREYKPRGDYKKRNKSIELEQVEMSID